MTNKQASSFYYLLIIGLSLLLSACDGGLFGTGDGSDNNIMIEGESGSDTQMGVGENTGGTTGDSTGSTTGSSTGTTGETTGATTADSASSQSDSTTAEFYNMQPGGQINAPQIRVLNLTPLNVQVNANNNEVINELQPEQDSGRIELPVNTNQLSFKDTATLNLDGSIAFHTIAPFSAAEFSITTIILRNNEGANAINVITLSTQSESSDPTTALVRLVQSIPLDDTTDIPSMTLAATEPNNSGTDISFDGLTFATQATDYLDVLPGTYQLSDADSRFANETITIEAGRVYSIVINSTTTPVTRIIEDSQ